MSTAMGTRRTISSTMNSNMMGRRGSGIAVADAASLRTEDAVSTLTDDDELPYPVSTATTNRFNSNDKVQVEAKCNNRGIAAAEKRVPLDDDGINAAVAAVEGFTAG